MKRKQQFPSHWRSYLKQQKSLLTEEAGIKKKTYNNQTVFP
jgi:hypothetical protein